MLSFNILRTMQPNLKNSYIDLAIYQIHAYYIFMSVKQKNSTIVSKAVSHKLNRSFTANNNAD